MLISPNHKSKNWENFANIKLSIYLAWISVATIANTAIVLYYLGWNGWGISPQIWSGGILILAGAIPARIILVRGDTAFVLVYIWTLTAIAQCLASRCDSFSRVPHYFGKGRASSKKIWSNFSVSNC